MSTPNQNQPTLPGLLFIACVVWLVTVSQSGWAKSASPESTTEIERIEEILVRGQRSAPPTEPSPLTKTLLNVPGTFGDSFAAVFTLPGVVEESEGDGQPAVRGSGPEDNAFLIDYLPASYVFHDLGFSIFNEHLIRDFGLHAAGFGPEYEQATGAIFDVSLRTPRNQPLTTTLDLSFLRAGVLVEGALTERSGVYFSARQSTYHLLLKAFEDDLEEDDDISINRYPKWLDYQGKYSWSPNDNHNVSLLVLGSNDGASLSFGSRSDEALLDPGSTGRADLDTQFNSQGLTWTYSDENTEFRAGLGHLEESTEQRLGDGRDSLELDTTLLTVKAEYQRSLNARNSLRAGTELRRQRFRYDLNLRYQSCTRFSADCDDPIGEVLVLDDKQTVDTYAGFVQYRWQPSEALSFTPSVRYTRNEYLKETYVEPRVRVDLSVSDRLSMHANYGTYHQLPFIDEIAPIVGNPNLKAPEATHYVVGGSFRLNDRWNTRLDVYHKDLRNLVVDVEDDRNYTNGASGDAYGIEFMLRRELTKRWSGWATMSWSKSKRTNNLTNERFAADYDKPIVVNVVANYALNKWNLSARWSLQSGAPYTPITGNRVNPDFPDAFLPVYGQLNSKRASSFHRLDLRAARHFEFGRMKGSYYIDVINAYGAKNSGGVYYEPNENSQEFNLKKEDGLPILPSIGLTLSF